MMADRRGLVGSTQYVKRPGRLSGDGAQTGFRSSESSALQGAQYSECAISWDRASLDLSSIRESSIDRSRHRFRASLPHLIWNAAALEGNTFTLPEVQTLLDGVTVGGKPTSDALQIIALSEGYSRLDEMVGSGEFSLIKPVSDAIHARVAVHEAIESGHFRGQGQAGGGGTARLANGGIAPGFPVGPNGELLVERFERTARYLSRVADPRERALAYFASATRQQFYFDGNKRTSRLMMSGELMAHGFDVVSVPFARKFEFNTALDELFTTDDATPLMSFLISCAGAEL